MIWPAGRETALRTKSKASPMIWPAGRETALRTKSKASPMIWPAGRETALRTKSKAPTGGASAHGACMAAVTRVLAR
jgi:hypothetical protein